MKCKNCQGEIEQTEDSFSDAWYSTDGFFCCIDCMARWYGSPVNECYDSWEDTGKPRPKRRQIL